MPIPGDVMVGGSRRRSRRWLLGGGAAVVLVAVVALALVRADSDSGSAAEDPADSASSRALAVAQDFLDAWEQKDWDRLQALTDQSFDAGTAHAEADRVLSITGATYTAGQPVESEDEVTVPFDATWTIDGLGEYAFSSSLTLRRTESTATPAATASAPESTGPFVVDWWYTVVHPALDENRGFERVRDRRPRAPILAADDTPIVTTAELVVIGVQPERVEDPEAVGAAVAEHAGADPAEVTALLAREDLDPVGFYPVAELPRAAYEEVRDALFPVPGLVFETRSVREGEVPASAERLVGHLGEITAELLEEFGAPYRQGDVVGVAGLERAYEPRLAGEPRQEALISDGSGIVESLLFADGAEPEPVQTTLDLRLQAAAEQALDGTAQPAAIVAIDHATGEIRAAVSTPFDDFDRALAGRYPPGSSFKIAVAAAALAEGLSPQTPLVCPPEVRIGGRVIGNAGDLGPGEITFAEAVAISCNTAFAQMATDLGAEAVTAAAVGLGFNTEYTVGLAANGGSYPEPADPAELAASSIGQARVLASPMHMASVAGAAASGTWRAPHLVRGLEPVASDPLPPEQQAALAGMLRLVVTDGTGRAANVPGEPVFGKTGSAEFGTGEDLATHAWFVGYQGPLAFAVFVEGGGGGGAVAAPIAARFLTEVGGGQVPAEEPPEEPLEEPPEE